MAPVEQACPPIPCLAPAIDAADGLPPALPVANSKPINGGNNTATTVVGTPPTPALRHAGSFTDVEAVLRDAEISAAAAASSSSSAAASLPQQRPVPPPKRSFAPATASSSCSPTTPAGTPPLSRTPPQPRAAGGLLFSNSRSAQASSSTSSVTSSVTPGVTPSGLPVTRAVQEHENDVARVVMVCEPEGSSLSMGGLHPRGSLYERPVNTERAKSQHAAFRQLLRDHGVRVLTVREILAHGVDRHVRARVELEDLAAATLTYQMAVGTSVDDLTEGDRHFLSDTYKRQVIEHMSVDQLIDVVLTNPTVHLTPSYTDTGLTASYTFEPLSNLVYTRDQQITTARGVVMGRLRSRQRQWEVDLMRFCLGKLGMPIIGEIEAPGFLEGGDFFPLGLDLALVGVGLRSNFEACCQLMERDLLGTRRLGVVRDDFDRHQDRMHLDSIFSPIGPRTCLLLSDAIGHESPLRRVVDEYVRYIDSTTTTDTAQYDAAAGSSAMAATQNAGGIGQQQQQPSTGAYRLERSGVELSEFLAGEGFTVIPLSGAHQREYACNVLNLGGGRLISAHAPSARLIASHPAFSGDVSVIDFSSVTSMYGSCHCATQVLCREPRRGAMRCAQVLPQQWRRAAAGQQAAQPPVVGPT